MAKMYAIVAAVIISVFVCIVGITLFLIMKQRKHLNYQMITKKELKEIVKERKKSV